MQAPIYYCSLRCAISFVISAQLSHLGWPLAPASEQRFQQPGSGACPAAAGPDHTGSRSAGATLEPLELNVNATGAALEPVARSSSALGIMREDAMCCFTLGLLRV